MALPGRSKLRLMAADNIVEIEDLHFAYNRHEVFKGLSLKIPRGKVVAILGASGCGKTTLLKLIGGQLRPSRGRIRVDGKVVHELGTDALYALRREMGMMKLQAVGLRGAQGLMPADLSGGMSRRIALARAIAADPMLTMYDEPFAGLDPITLNVIAELVRKLNDAIGTTSIVVTYDVSESLKVVDYIYVISDGVVVGEGAPEAVAASEDPYLKQFMHALPDGPVRFHFPAEPIDEALRIA